MGRDSGSWYVVRFGLTPASTLVFGFAFERGINWKRAYRVIFERRFASTLILDLSRSRYPRGRQCCYRYAVISRYPASYGNVHSFV